MNIPSACNLYRRCSAKKLLPISQLTVFVRSNSTKSRRVVVTGLGVISPIGCTASTAWSNLINGHCGITKLDSPEYQQLPCRIAGRLSPNSVPIDKYFTKSELKTMSHATVLALIAADEALTMANWKPTEMPARLRTGVAVGTGMVDLIDVCETNEALKKGYNRVSPFFVPRILPNMLAGQISMKYKFHGPNHAVSTACATGAHAIGDSFRFIRGGDADVMICGGAESCISPLAIAGFSRLRALTTVYNETPTISSRPFDRDRSGFVMGEGAGILILEELQHAQLRGADILAEIFGYGLSGDAAHLTAPHKDGFGATLAMQRALHDAQMAHDSVGYVNAHATSTPIGDAIETRAIKTVFGDHQRQLAVSSTKGAHGHLLGAAGNLEAIFTILACKTGIVPPTINLENVTDDMDLNYVPNKAQEWRKPVTGNRRIALKNAFGFGGTNACLCIGEFML